MTMSMAEVRFHEAERGAKAGAKRQQRTSNSHLKLVPPTNMTNNVLLVTSLFLHQSLLELHTITNLIQLQSEEMRLMAGASSSKNDTVEVDWIEVNKEGDEKEDENERVPEYREVLDLEQVKWWYQWTMQVRKGRRNGIETTNILTFLHSTHQHTSTRADSSRIPPHGFLCSRSPR